MPDPQPEFFRDLGKKAPILRVHQYFPMRLDQERAYDPGMRWVAPSEF